MNDAQKKFVADLKDYVNGSKAVSAETMKKLSKLNNIRVPWKIFKAYEVSTDVYDCSIIFDHVDSSFSNYVPQTKKQPQPAAPKFDIEVELKKEKVVSNVANIDCSFPAGFFVPKINDRFISFGPMNKVRKIIKSGKFCPTYIFGETGLAKSMSVSQLASREGKEVIRIGVNAHTNEDDFFGGFRLINGETVWQDGPLILAMKRGATLLIDEITALNPAYAFILFGALENEPVYIKKTNIIVEPAAGFNIIATDNTKGYGSSSGKYVGVNVQNEALLDRFRFVVEYEYPTAAAEFKILSSVGSDERSMKELIVWANFVREAYKDGSIDVTISTRKLVAIMELNEIFGSLKESIQGTVARYEEDTISALVDFFEKIVTNPENVEDAFKENLPD